MSYLLNIDTCSEAAAICISRNGRLLHSALSNTRNHASFIHPAINNLLLETEISYSDLAAISVTEGPGSYTGLRIGMASAKGLAFALNIPLVAVNSLLLIAMASKTGEKKVLYCPMIEARRMEVFMALYDENFNTLITPTNMILNENSLSEYLDHRIVFCGSGCIKFAEMFNGSAFFSYNSETMSHFCDISFNKFIAGEIIDLIKKEPLYIKPFYDQKR